MIWELWTKFRNKLIRLETKRQPMVIGGTFNRELWRLISKPEGIEPKKQISCPNCFVNESRKEEMVYRRSELGQSPELGYRNAVLELLFKCPRCGFESRFGIAVPADYFLKMKSFREKHGLGRIYAPEDRWTKSEIKERLKQLGYW